MLQPPDKLPQSDLNPFERQWTRWLQGQEVSRKNFQKKLKKKLRDDYINLKKEYEQKIANLHIELSDQRYYVRSMLDFVREATHNPWGRAVFRSMCNDN